jgi:hypothetical protein
LEGRNKLLCGQETLNPWRPIIVMVRKAREIRIDVRDIRDSSKGTFVVMDKNFGCHSQMKAYGRDSENDFDDMKSDAEGFFGNIPKKNEIMFGKYVKPQTRENILAVFGYKP